MLLRNPCIPALLDRLSASALRSGYEILLIPALFESLPAAQESILRKLDGIVVVDPSIGDDGLAAFIKARHSLVTIGRWIDHDEYAWVDNDHRGSFVALFKRLVEQSSGDCSC